MVEEYRISYCLFLTTIMIASDNWLNLFKNDFKLRQIYSGDSVKCGSGRRIRTADGGWRTADGGRRTADGGQ